MRVEQETGLNLPMHILERVSFWTHRLAALTSANLSGREQDQFPSSITQHKPVELGIAFIHSRCL
ncbi:hypothetical protein BDZ89DRAFT_143535 [Hymenopellis radicata]|nr:hypothetical protein BDZ89DRAFT_143535 [Hymenopellis radicata]